MSLATSVSTAPGTYRLSVTGVSGSITRTTSVTLTVDPEGTTVVSYRNPTVIAIPDYNTAGISSAIDVPDGLSILGASVTVDVTHTYVGDLEIALTSPAGTRAVLHNRAGGAADNLHQTFGVSAFNGQNARGIWTLTVRDLAAIDVGTLDGWTLTIKGVGSPSPTPIDITAPTVSITSPAPGARVSGSVTVEAAATDSGGVAEVRFYADGVSIGTDVSSPYAVSWNAAGIADGSHTLTAQAVDRAGNAGNSEPISVIVDRTAPVLSSVRALDVAADRANIAWTTNEGSTSQVEYGATTAYESITPVDTRLATDHVVALAGLRSGTVYHYRVRSTDAAGNTAVSGDLTFTSALTPAASVSITSATWSSAKRELNVSGTVSNPNAMLTATFAGRTEAIRNVNGNFRGRFEGVASNPGSVAVTANDGGSDTAVVTSQ